MKYLNAAAKAALGEIYLYGEITDTKWYDEAVTPTSIKNELDKVKDVDEVNLYVNSPGGGVFAGLAIYNEIKRINKPVTAYIDGIAASIASLIVLAADRVVMPFNSMLMIHNPWTCVCGSSKDLRDVADRMDKMSDNVLVETYIDKTGLSKEKLAKMMDAETWMNGKEAVELGFADEVAEEQKIAACYVGNNVKFQDVEYDLNKFKAFPKAKFTEHKPINQVSQQQRHRHFINMLSAKT